MKSLITKKFLFSSIFITVLTSTTFANTIVPAPAFVTAPGKFYIGAFGGGGSTNSYHVDQYGTAFFTEAEGGPLAVNSFGSIGSKSFWFAGGQVGYLAPEIIIDPQSQLAIAPAIELEGYAIGNSTLHGEVFNETDRLPEHDFVVSYPVKRSVFLVNAVLNFNIHCVLFHPYIAAGFGSAILRISGADSIQIDPPELDINHYNANTSDTVTTFAGQIKVGLSYDINDYVNIFAEYRGLYLSTSHFIFGSTVYSTHSPTSSWQVALHPQFSNMGDVGIRFNL